MFFLVVVAVFVWVPDQKAAELQRLIRDLGSPVFAEREAASAALEKVGEPALDALEAAWGSTDPEVRLRAGRAIEAIEADLSQEVRRFEGHSGRVRCMAFSHDGRLALSGGGDTGGDVRLWEVGTGKLVRRLTGHRKLVWSLAIAPDGRHAVSANADEVIVWELCTGKLRRRFDWGACGLAFFPDGKRFVAGERVVEVEGSKEPTRLIRDDMVSDVAVSRDGRRVLFGRFALFPQGFIRRDEVEHYRRSLVVQLYDAETEKVRYRLEGHEHPITRVAFSPDGRRLLSADTSGTVRVWDTRSGKHLGSVSIPLHIPGQPLVFSPDGRRVLSGDKDELSLWDLATGKELRRFQGHPGGAYSVAFSPDGRFALSGGRDGTVRLWRMPK